MTSTIAFVPWLSQLTGTIKVGFIAIFLVFCPTVPAFLSQLTVKRDMMKFIDQTNEPLGMNKDMGALDAWSSLGTSGAMASRRNVCTPLKIVVDTREQQPYTFTEYSEVQSIRHGLKTGDYSLAGYEDRVALERKSLDDLIGCLTTGRNRFERELERAKALDYFAVVVEASLEDVRQGMYRSKLNPHAALQSIITFQVRYGTTFIWAGSRAGGEYMAHGLLEKFRREKESLTNGPKPKVVSQTIN